MITLDKIIIYKKYEGDIDSWARNGSQKEKLIITDQDWYLIDGFIQDLSLVKKGLASLAFTNNLTYKLKESCDSAETIQALEKITV